MTGPSEPTDPPVSGWPLLLRIVRGVPDGVDVAVEVAALAAVLATRGGSAPAAPAPLSAWAARDRLVRAPLVSSVDGWRASALPR